MKCSLGTGKTVINEMGLALIPLRENDKLAINISTRLSAALVEHEGTIYRRLLNFLLFSRAWKRTGRATKFVGTVKHYPPSCWNLPKFLKWKMVSSLQKVGREISEQNELGIFPAMLAPDSYGYEEETDVMPLIGFLLEALTDKTRFPAADSQIKCAGVYRAQLLRKSPAWYVSPGFVVTLNTVVNLCADAFEFGLQEFLWPDGTQDWSFSASEVIAKFHQEASRDDEEALRLSEIMRSFSRRLAEHLEWLGDYTKRYREHRGQQLSRTEDGINVKASPFLLGNIDIL